MPRPLQISIDPDQSTAFASETRPGFSTLAVHGGEARQKLGNSITDPIFLASTYTFANTQSLLDFIRNQEPREEYVRYGHPGMRTVEQKLAMLEGAEAAALFSSGMSAFVTLLLTRLSAGDEVLIFDECYHRSREFCLKHLSRFGVRTIPVPTGDLSAMQRAMTPQTRMLVCELPTNPHLSVIDLEGFVELGRRHGVETLVDSTLATPFNLRPLELGVDYVLHSATKYLGGHNDLLAGALLGSQAKLDSVQYLRGILGCISSPHCCYLLERGLKTFELRMQRHNANGQAVAQFLEAHARVERVYYPGLESHRDAHHARRLLRGFGGLVTFLLRDADWQTTACVVDAVRLPRIAPSLGGVESLIEQPMIMSHFHATPEERRNWGIPDNMIRLACGIEDTADLIADLDQALSAPLRPAPC